MRLGKLFFVLLPVLIACIIGGSIVLRTELDQKQRYESLESFRAIEASDKYRNMTEVQQKCYQDKLTILEIYYEHSSAFKSRIRVLFGVLLIICGFFSFYLDRNVKNNGAPT